MADRNSSGLTTTSIYVGCERRMKYRSCHCCSSTAAMTAIQLNKQLQAAIVAVVKTTTSNNPEPAAVVRCTTSNNILATNNVNLQRLVAVPVGSSQLETSASSVK
ncbi:hypothetical protein CBL_04176 [Carabus blaptoides fortunei]